MISIKVLYDYIDIQVINLVILKYININNSVHCKSEKAMSFYTLFLINKTL